MGVRALRRALGTPDEWMREAWVRVENKDEMAGGVVVLVEEFLAALKKVAPSVSKAQRRRYEALGETFGCDFAGSGKEGTE
jgi:ribosome biogenesis ATPase